jgi:hypothetical protein
MNNYNIGLSFHRDYKIEAETEELSIEIANSRALEEIEQARKNGEYLYDDISVDVIIKIRK